MINMEDCYMLSDNINLMEDDEIILYGNNKIFLINETLLHILKMISETPKTVNQVIDMMKAEYDISDDLLKGDIISTFEDLKRGEIIIEVDDK